jgi:hypothetical protein
MLSALFTYKYRVTQDEKGSRTEIFAHLDQQMLFCTLTPSDEAWDLVNSVTRRMRLLC